MENHEVFSDGEALQLEVSQHMKSLTGKVYSKFGAQSHMNFIGALNPNLGSLNFGMGTVHCESNKDDITSTHIITSLEESTNLSLLTMNPSSTYGADDHESWAASTNANESIANVNHMHNIDDVANIFDVSLNSLKEIEEFAKDLLLGKQKMWSLMTKEKCNEITEIVCNRYSYLEFGSQSKGNPIIDDNPSSKASPNDPKSNVPIVQSVDINTKSTSYAGVA
nr:hypothetical protein [Tanacetum cinerariifolium]